MVFAGELVEVLLSVVLMLNVGAYSLLWRKIRQEKEDKEEIKQEVSDIRQSLNDLWQRIYGSDEDKTMEGHLVETEDRFDSIDKQLESLAKRLEESIEDRKQEHQEVQEQMEKIADVLEREEKISAEKSDIFSD